MKKAISILLSISVMIIAIFGCITAFASVSYDVNTKTITVSDKGEFNEPRIYENVALDADKSVRISVDFEEGITVLGQDVMAGCQQLEAVSIPKSVTTIKKGCFSDCENLKSVYYAGTKSEFKQVRIEREGNEDFRDAKVVYGELDEVNYIPLYVCLAALFAVSACLTFVATRKARKK